MSTFCYLPWIHLSTKSNGQLRVCCNANQGPQYGLLRAEDGRILNLKTDDFREAFNAPLLREIRRAMVAGERHAECIRCWREEDSGFESRRRFTSKLWSHIDPAALLAQTDSSGATTVKPVFLDLRFGNRCNLKCRMCGPSDSDQWYAEFVALNGRTFKDGFDKVELAETESGRFVAVDTPYDWYENQMFWDALDTIIEKIEHMYFVGGEPLIIEQHHRFLERIVERGYASKISLEYNTNLTNIQNRVLTLWTAFKKVSIGVSLDSIGRMNDYIRHPSKFGAIQKNIDKLKTIDSVSFWIAPTIQNHNVYYLPEIYDHHASANPGVRIAPHFLHRPNYYSITSLPFSVKTIVSDRLRAYAANLPSTIAKTFDATIAFMNARDETIHWSHFVATTNRLDALRGQSLRDVMPEFFATLEPHWNA